MSNPSDTYSCLIDGSGLQMSLLLLTPAVVSRVNQSSNDYSRSQTRYYSLHLYATYRYSYSSGHLTIAQISLTIAAQCDVFAD